MSIDGNRREFLTRAGMGFGSLAASSLLSGQKLSSGTAKSVISLFMHGGPSHLDTLDPKPLLNKMHGQLVPDSFGNVRLQFSTFKERPILGSGRQFARHGASGLEISDLFPIWRGMRTNWR